METLTGIITGGLGTMFIKFVLGQIFIKKQEDTPEVIVNPAGIPLEPVKAGMRAGFCV